MSRFHPSFQIIESTQTTLLLNMSNVPISLLNSIRRVVKHEIPQVAFDLIKFKSYTGKMNEEVLAHRIALLPITCEKVKNFLFREECKSCILGCEKCNITFTLNKSNDDEKDIMNVYSNDLIIEKNLFKSEIIKFPTNDKGVLLCRLNPGESICLECKAVKGIGREHAKYSSTNVCTFQENDEDDTILFFIETNHNVNALSMFRLSLEIISEKIQKMKRCLKLRVKDFQTEIKVPFSETIMNPLQYYIETNFAKEIDLFLYKRNHVLDTISSNLKMFSEDGKNNKEIINNALDYFDMDIKFLESSVMNEIFSVA